MIEHSDLYAVVPAAGSGSRMNCDIPKQHISVDGVSILNRTIARLLQVASLKKIVVVVDVASIESAYKSWQSDSRVEICSGGVSRSESVRNGLRYLKQFASPESRVMVHDAARPCVRVDDINQLVSAVADDINGGLLAMQVIDTIKQANDKKQAIATLERDTLWRAATPQLFLLEGLFKAVNKALDDNMVITDEASAMQYAGYFPKLVECHSDNIKITTATDLILAQHYLSAQTREYVEKTGNEGD